MRNRRRQSVVASLTILGSTLAGNLYGGPPFITDDPEPVDYQHWEFYIASQDSKLGGDWSGTAPHFELNYGVVPDVQLHLIAPLAYDAPPDGRVALRLWRHGIGRKIPVHPGDQLPAASGNFPAAGSADRQCAATISATAICRPSCRCGCKKAGDVDGLRRRRLRHQFLFRQPELGICRGGAAKAGAAQRCSLARRSIIKPRCKPTFPTRHRVQYRHGH